MSLINFYVEYRFLQNNDNLKAFTIYYKNCFLVYVLLTLIS